MEACPDRQETLYMDVHGELESACRSDWQQHLAACKGCCRERERLVQMLQTVKAAVAPPRLANDKTEEMVRSVTRQLRRNPIEPWWERWGVFKPARLVPALAAAVLLVVAVTWYNTGDMPNSISGPVAMDEQYVEDLDVINNLELLEEMETIQKLVQLVDKAETDKPMESRRGGVGRKEFSA